MSDGGKLWCYPAFEVGTLHDGAQVHSRVAKPKLGFIRRRESDFGLLHGLVQSITEIFIDQRDQGVNLAFDGRTDCGAKPRGCKNLLDVTSTEE